MLQRPRAVLAKNACIGCGFFVGDELAHLSEESVDRLRFSTLLATAVGDDPWLALCDLQGLGLAAEGR